MKRILIILFLLICLPVQAEQFRQFNNIIINKNYITHIKMYDGGICMYYPAGYGDLRMELASTCLIIKNKEQRIEKFNEIKQWLNQENK